MSHDDFAKGLALLCGHQKCKIHRKNIIFPTCVEVLKRKI